MKWFTIPFSTFYQNSPPELSTSPVNQKTKRNDSFYTDSLLYWEKLLYLWEFDTFTLALFIKTNIMNEIVEMKDNFYKLY